REGRTVMGNILAVIGGSGLYDVSDLESVGEVRGDTPLRAANDSFVRGRAQGTRTTMLFFPPPGRGPPRSPSGINYRANICALKLLGATCILSVSAVGSMREEIAPGNLVVVDQLIDLTKRRASTFFDDGVAAHVAFADPICPVMAGAVYEAAQTTS